jgi:riboflavin kinase/FMN adenylyltransferase
MRISHGFAPLDQPHAVTIGNFDGLHLGHKAMLARLQDVAAARDLPACVLSFEPHPREFFAPDAAPVRLSSLREKAEKLAEWNVDRFHVFRFNQKFSTLAPEDFILKVLADTLRARYVLVGDDFRYGARRSGNFSLLVQLGQQLDFDTESLVTVEVGGERASSTAVRAALEAGDLDRAATLLGRPYSISGRVEHGDKLGRDLGFPTANIQLKHNRPPLMGIFAVEVAGLADKPLPGVASLGRRPTVKNPDAVPVLEVHLFDFDADIYRRRVRVDFLHKLRDEAKYPDLDSLVAQIHRDCAAARTYLSQLRHV